MFVLKLFLKIFTLFLEVSHFGIPKLIKSSKLLIPTVFQVLLFLLMAGMHISEGLLMKFFLLLEVFEPAFLGFSIFALLLVLQLLVED